MLPLSSYFSLLYLAILLPGTVLAYTVLPQKYRRAVLLLSSYAVFWLVSGKLLCYLLFSTISVHHIGLWLENTQLEANKLLETAPKETRKDIRVRTQRRRKKIVAFGIAVQFGILLALKYGAFFISNFNEFAGLIKVTVNLPVPSVILPIGISFYTMQAASYMLDVYQEKIPADRNLMRLALYMSFFPQLMEGPICRYSDTAQQLWDAPPMRWKNLMLGLQRILWGIMKKMVVADRLNLLITEAFDNYIHYDGFMIAAAVVCYTVQLYMDFSGTMDLVLGSGQIFGIKLPENFQRPFFSRTIQEFWRRWHITLGAWFRDYVFYPISLSAPIKKLPLRLQKRLGRTYGFIFSSIPALFCVWLCNGLWHGAGWNFIFFGMYHFALILVENIMEPPAVWLAKRLHINRDSILYRCMQIVRTAVLFCIGELFFRASTLKAGFAMFKKIFTDFTLARVRDNTFFSHGADKHDFLIVVVTLTLILAVGCIQERGVSVRQWIEKRNLAFRLSLWYLLILFIVIFGAYGTGYIPVDPIYAGF